jgi:hypothetical protein
MTHSFDGHANCFVESGNGKALLLDFNYDTEPLTGTSPAQGRPMSLLKESRANHLGKLAFRHIYWNVLLPGRPMPLPAAMSMLGGQERRIATTPQGEATTMPTTTIAGRQIDVDAEGFLTKPEQWDEARRDPRSQHRHHPHRGALGADPVPAQGLRDPEGDRDVAPGLDGGRHTGQGAVRALPRQAGQEDVLHRRAAEAQGLRLSQRHPP